MSDVYGFTEASMRRTVAAVKRTESMLQEKVNRFPTPDIGTQNIQFIRVKGGFGSGSGVVSSGDCGCNSGISGFTSGSGISGASGYTCVGDKLSTNNLYQGVILAYSIDGCTLTVTETDKVVYIFDCRFNEMKLEKEYPAKQMFGLVCVNCEDRPVFCSLTMGKGVADAYCGPHGLVTTY